MSTKKINSIDQVKELFKNYVSPTYIGSKEYNRLELSPQQAIWKSQNLMRVCSMALMGINESYSNFEIKELTQNSKADLNDVIECLEIATKMLPIVEMEFLDRLQTDLID